MKVFALIMLLMATQSYSDLRADEVPKSVPTYIFVQEGGSSKLTIAVNGKVVNMERFETYVTNEYLAKGGRGVEAALILSPKCKLATLWDIRGLLTKIGFGVKVYSASSDVGSMTELTFDGPRIPVPESAAPPK